MKRVTKVCACVVRATDNGPELLCFEHPHAGVQLPKGSLEPGEDPIEGVLRELHEEAGLLGLQVTAHVGTSERKAGAGPHESGPLECHVWEIYLITATMDGPDEWWHRAWGSPEEEGLMFRCHWLPIDEHLSDAVHPLFGPVVTMLGDHLAGRSVRR